jgi:hypothetical protein
MRQRGRKSADQLAVNVSGGQRRLATPKGLTAKEREAFERLVNTTSPEQFRPGDTPLLVALAQATIQAHKLGRDSSRIADWERATRVMMALSTKLRLTPQSRADAKTIGRMQSGLAPWHGELRKPWEMKPSPLSPDDDDDDDDDAPIQ